jgi:hypothetical protein
VSGEQTASLRFTNGRYRSMKVHWLFPIPLSISAARCFHLASVRLRLAVACSAQEDSGYSVSVGEELPPDVRVVIVPKIGSDDIDRRSPRWLAAILEAKKRGARVILDYTDHHLGFDSPMKSFYELAIQLCDLCVVSSAYLKSAVSAVRSVYVIEIRDTLEYPIFSTRPQKGVEPAVLWFGHGSNFSFLVNFLHENNLTDHCFSLEIVSSNDVVNWVNEHRHLIKVKNLKATEWSVEALREAAERSDISLLPLGLTDPRKAGASSNRLITSFALGLPVITQSIASYSEYRRFYTDINQDDFLSCLRNPSQEHEKVYEAQQTILAYYDPKLIGAQWISAVQVALN